MRTPFWLGLATSLLLLQSAAIPARAQTQRQETGKPEIGSLVPELVLPDGQGAPQSLRAARGKVVYLDFWASWCAPCKQSFPWMDSLHQRYGPQGLVILAVNLDQERDAAERFLTKTPVSFTRLYDPKGETARLFGVSAMPHSFLIDRGGQVRAVHRGFRPSDAEALEADIRKALAG